MPATLDALLKRPELRLRLMTPRDGSLRTPIEWVMTTELRDPAPFLTGGQLVLTTGMRLRSERAQRAFTRAIREAGSAGLGLGTGFTHDDVPEGILRAAAEVGLPVFEVPYETPFADITRAVADARASEQFAELETLHRQHHQLVASLLGGAGLPGLVERLAALTGARIAVSRFGELIAGSLEPGPGADGWDALPVAASPTTQATLHASRPRRSEPLLHYARSLVSLQLTQEGRRTREAREHAGLQLADLIGGRLSPGETEARLGALGLRPGERYRMLVAQEHGARTAGLASLPLPASLDAASCPSGLVDGRLVVLLPASHEASPAAEAIVALARSAGIALRLGIGDAYPVARSLRWSWFEALDALTTLPGGQSIGRASRLSPSALILAARDVPVAELADELLAPLERSDAEQGTSLVRTLSAYLDRSGAVAEIAAELGTHRNTIRYRLDQITALTGLDPRITHDAVQWWLALAARRVTGHGESTRDDAERGRPG